MEQHPVPQQISSYQFRLVGDMTLKQFFELAGGALVGLLFYTSSIPPIIKWPLIIVSVLFGIALAFLPFEDRPLEIWVVAFFRSIYSPTLYYWQKTTVQPQYFQPETGQVLPLGVIAPGGEASLNKYLKEKPNQRIPSLAKLDAAESGYLSKVTGLFNQLVPSSKTPTQPTTPIQQAPQVTTVTVQATPMPVQARPVASITPQPAPASIPILPTKPIEVPGMMSTANAASQRSQISIPTMQAVRVAPSTPVSIKTPAVAVEEYVPATPVSATSVAPILQAEKSSESAQTAQFSLAASPPMPPSQPNTVSGQVMDAQGRIIEAAILEIKDSGGRPVRAVKTNKLGHFFIVTPLSNGIYEVLTEKDGYQFSPVSFTAEGALIPPIAVHAMRNPTN